MSTEITIKTCFKKENDNQSKNTQDKRRNEEGDECSEEDANIKSMKYSEYSEAHFVQRILKKGNMCFY